MKSDCLFCVWRDGRDREIQRASEHFYLVADGQPVSQGHSLIISKRHFEDVRGMTEAEAQDFFRFRQTVLRELEDTYHPDGFNTGENTGDAAGQSVYHYHHHIIPRYREDVSNPRGGIRNVVPHRGHH